jgi:DNA-binding CsgD family transcriptional regulator
MRAKAPVIERRETVLFRLLWRGIHYVARSSPLDPATFSCTGVFTIMMPAPTADDTGEIQAIPVLAEPTFGDLAALTPRELEVLYFAARGLQKPEIAAKIYRAVKTIDHHIASIHEKLGIHTRGELSSWAAARGFLAFTPEQWTSFVAKKQSHNHETTSGYFESQVLKLV